MDLCLIHHGLLGLFRLVTSTLMAGWMSSPMSWSADGQWLSYTVATDAPHGCREPGWLFETAPNRPAVPSPRRPIDSRVPPGTTAYQIWATCRDVQTSVLIEESAWPLTAPSWSPLGKSVGFGRFVPQSMEPNQPVPRGRLEVVIQDGLDRKRILWVLPDFELDALARAGFPHLSATWSPDGQYLAFPKPGRQQGIMIIKTDERKLVQTLDHALFASWSPDSSKLAFIHAEDEYGRLQLVERHGPTFVAPRSIAATGRVTAAPCWSGDGRSIFVVIEKSTTRSQELELSRAVLETGEVIQMMSLAPEAFRRGARIRGVALDFDREEEKCFFSVDMEGRDAELVLSLPLERTIKNRIHPVDISLRIAGLAASPDGRSVALRFGSPGALTPPAIYDVASDRTFLVIPDETARQAWLTILIDVARTLLLAGLPPVAGDGWAVGRPTLLPLPGEIPAHLGLPARLSRLGRFGSSLCRPPHKQAVTDEGAGRGHDGDTTSPWSDRLFFNYLRGDFASAAEDLEALEPHISSREQRMSLLSLRAQILWSQGELSRARAVVDYLLSTGGGDLRRVEETPLGLFVATESSPRQTWARYLSERIAEGARAPAAPPYGPREERIDPPFPNRFEAPHLPLIERGEGPGAVPFAPIPRRLDPRRIGANNAQPVRPQNPPQTLRVPGGVLNLRAR
jgi:hypothetical protein